MKTFFMKNRKKDIVLAVTLSLFIISFAIVFTVFFKYLYYFDIHYLDITSYTYMSEDIIKMNYDILIQYQSLFFRGTLNMPNFIMSETGRIHFEEVKRIFEMIQILCIGTGIISSVLIYQSTKEKEYRYLKMTSILTVTIPTVIGFLASLDFDQAFVIFHKIFFRNDYWIFDSYTDPVIRILPQDFFMHCFILIIVIIMLLSSLCYLIYKRKEREIIKEDL